MCMVAAIERNAKCGVADDVAMELCQHITRSDLDQQSIAIGDQPFDRVAIEQRMSELINQAGAYRRRFSKVLAANRRKEADLRRH